MISLLVFKVGDNSRLNVVVVKGFDVFLIKVIVIMPIGIVSFDGKEFFMPKFPFCVLGL